MGTFITAVVLIGIIAFVVKSMIKQKKSGKSIQCGCDCSHCGGHCH